MSISLAWLRVRISSACASEAWSGCDFLFASSEATTQQSSKSLAETAFMVMTSTIFQKCVWGFRGHIPFLLPKRREQHPSLRISILDTYSIGLESTLG